MRLKCYLLLISCSALAQAMPGSYFRDDTWIPGDMLQNMNLAVDPCDDFYQYSCGNFVEKATIPPYETSWALGWSTMRAKVEEITTELLDKDEGEAGIYYRSCMNTQAVESSGISELSEWLQATNEVNNLKDLTDFMVTAELFDFTTFLSFGVATNPDYPLRHVGYLGSGKLTLPGSPYYKKSSGRYPAIRQTMLDVITKLFQMTGLSNSEAAEAAHQVQLVETEMVRGMASKSKLRTADMDFLSIDDLKRHCPSIVWSTFFEDLGIPTQASNASLLHQGFVAMRDPAYLDALHSTVLTRFDIKAIRAYLRWRVISVYSPYLPQAYRDQMHALSSAISETQARSPDQRRCFQATLRRLPDATSRLYVEHALPRASRVEAQWMLQRIRNAFSADLAKLAWMDQATRARALRKLASMGFQVGQPDRWPDQEGDLPPLDLSPQRYLDNSMAIMVRAAMRDRQRLAEPVRRTEWGQPAAAVNAFYFITRNTLFIPAGMLQSPFFSPGGPLARNYGGVGVILGHEMSHGLDDAGSRYDAAGRVRQWWDPETLGRFQARTACVARQFAAFSDAEGGALNGNLTLGETIADAGGLHMAYKAMEAALGTASDDDRRLFFLSFAQLWCRKQRPAAEHAQVLSDPHPPGRFRVMGTLADSHAFAAAFGCPAGSAMNPRDKCIVW